MPEDILSFEEHSQRRDENPSLVRCARCGKMILATATRCPECRVHFQGEAWEFTHPSERETGGGRVRGWAVAVVVLLLATMLVVTVALR